MDTIFGVVGKNYKEATIMQQNYSPEESVKENIQIFLKTEDGKLEMEHFDYRRKDGYRTNIDAGYEDLNMHEDLAKILMYMQCDTIRFNNGRIYKVKKREFQPCIPVMLYLYVEEIL